MTDIEAKTILERDLNCLKQNKALPNSIEAMEIAIKALEKQIPKKPMKGEPYWWIDTVKVKGRNKEVRKKSYGHKCPCCGKGVAKLSNIFCNHCGQKLDWSDEE